MSRLDIAHDVAAAPTLAPAARTTSATGTGVDLANYDAAVVVVHAGTVTDGTHAVEVQESADDATYTAVSDADLGATEPTLDSTSSDSTIEIGYHGIARYVRVAVTTSGATTGGVFGATVVAAKPRVKPA